MNDFREFSKAYNNYLMHSNGRPGKIVHKTFLYKGMTPQDYVDELLSSKTKEEAIQNLNNRLNNPPVSYNPQEKRFFTECLRILQSQLNYSYNDFRDVHEDYLMHFGILGMKWGVRRYQNPDGTLTDAGKKRYSKERTKDIQNAVKNTKAYSKERYDAINEIIDKHSKNNIPTEEELKAKKSMKIL